MPMSSLFGLSAYYIDLLLRNGKFLINCAADLQIKVIFEYEKVFDRSGFDGVGGCFGQGFQ